MIDLYNMPLKDNEYIFLKNLVYEKIGINLTEKKKSLIENRLRKEIRKLGLKDFSQYCQYLKNEKSGQAILTLADHISTNHTFFFRENDSFLYFYKNILPEIRKKSNILRIWSAGCSAGEEAYSIAMIVHDFNSGNMLFDDIGILATDISVSQLETAEKGYYSIEKMTDIPVNYKTKYLKKCKNFKENQNFQIKEYIKKMILFKRFNLLDPFPFKGKFHVIFCRNVMIYFDDATRCQLIDKFYDFLYPDGYLLIGASEIVSRKASRFKYVKPAIYQKY